MRHASIVVALSCSLLTCCHSSTPESSAAVEPAPSPLGEIRPDPVANDPLAGLVVLATPTDEEPLESMPDEEELADIVGFDPTPERVALGSRLFHDTRLSKDHTVSCASCHDLRFAGVDHLPTAVGIGGQVGPINTPTVFNAVANVAQFWDGRAKDLHEQAAGPPEAPGEMGGNFPEIVRRLRMDSSYVEAFKAAFPDDVEAAGDISKYLTLEAVATFELTLTTTNSPFDRWLDGEAGAMTKQQLRGYALFKHIGCAECHYGPGVGGKAFQKLGRTIEYFTGDDLSHVDLGRFNVTGDERDRYSFKVPTLRNVEVTGPYFHNGKVTTLEEAVTLMAHHQLGVELEEGDTADIVAFLQSLSGEYQGRRLVGRSVEGQ